MTQNDLIITITDVRRAFCVAGARKWATDKNIDFRDFIKNGKPASELMGLGDDALLDRVILLKLGAENGG